MKLKFFAFVVLGAACLSLQSRAQTATPSMIELKPSENEDGFVSLFNGKDLTGWAGQPELWSVKDGAITGQTTKETPAKENTFLIWTNGKPGDFELRAKFKLVPGDEAGFANSGIQYRSHQVPSTRTHKMEYFVMAGYQADMEAGPNYTGICYEEKMRGIIANRGQKVVLEPGKKDPTVVGSVGNAKDIEAAVKKGDWNDYIIIAKGNHTTQIMNGLTTVDITDNDPKSAAKAGLIALQIHAGHPMMCQFKDIRIKELK